MLIVTILAVAAAGCNGGESEVAVATADENLVERVHELVDAHDRNDLSAVLGYFADDAAIRYRGEGGVKTKTLEDYERTLKSEFLLNLSMEADDCRAEGRSVACAIIETHDWYEAVGLGPWRVEDVRFEFDPEGQVRVIEVPLTDETIRAEIHNHRRALFGWAEQNRPEQFESLWEPGVDERKKRMDPEATETLLQLTRAWVEAGRPGLEAAREEYERKRAEHEQDQAAAKDR
jgi:hypothetical protein